MTPDQIAHAIENKTRVRKISGISFNGTIVGTATTLDGHLRIIVESDLIRGMLHIYTPQQYEVAE